MEEEGLKFAQMEGGGPRFATSHKPILNVGSRYFLKHNYVVSNKTVKKSSFSFINKNKFILVIFT